MPGAVGSATQGTLSRSTSNVRGTVHFADVPGSIAGPSAAMRSNSRSEHRRPRTTSGSEVLVASPSDLSAVEVSGFVGWLASGILWATYMAWAFLPPPLFAQLLGFPREAVLGDRYWALAAPALLVTVVCTFTSIYAAASMFANPGLDEFATLRDGATVAIAVAPGLARNAAAAGRGGHRGAAARLRSQPSSAGDTTCTCTRECLRCGAFPAIDASDRTPSSCSAQSGMACAHVTTRCRCTSSTSISSSEGRMRPSPVALAQPCVRWRETATVGAGAGDVLLSARVGAGGVSLSGDGCEAEQPTAAGGCVACASTSFPPTASAFGIDRSLLTPTVGDYPITFVNAAMFGDAGDGECGGECRGAHTGAAAAGGIATLRRRDGSRRSVT